MTISAGNRAEMWVKIMYAYTYQHHILYGECEARIGVRGIE